MEPCLPPVSTAATPYFAPKAQRLRVPFGVPPKKPETSQFHAFFLLFSGIWNHRILTLEHFRNRNIHWNTLDHIVQTLISSWNGRFFMLRQHRNPMQKTYPYLFHSKTTGRRTEWSTQKCVTLFDIFKSVTIIKCTPCCPWHGVHFRPYPFQNRGLKAWYFHILYAS